jgi:hypothetical protein
MHCVYAYLNALRLCKKMNPGQNDRGSFFNYPPYRAYTCTLFCAEGR